MLVYGFYAILWLFLAAIVLAVVRGNRRTPCDDCNYCTGRQCYHWRTQRLS